MAYIVTLSTSMRLFFAPILSGLILIALSQSSFGQYTFTTLDAPSTTNGTVAYGISGNNVVGFYYPNGSSNQSGFLYDGSTYTRLNDPLGVTTGALGISGNTIVGFYNTQQSLNPVHGYVYDITTQAYSTLDVPGGNGTIPLGISSNGTIVGQYYGATTAYGFAYSNGTFTTLSDPNAIAAGTAATGSYGNIIVGTYVGAGAINYGFIYDGSSYTTLDDPLSTHIIGPYNNQPTSTGTFVNGIYGNNIVGFYYDSNYIGHGFLYDGSTFTTIDAPLGAKGTSINGIDGNTLVGDYIDSNGVSHGFEAMLAPEPTSLALLGLGLCVLAWATHRRSPIRSS